MADITSVPLNADLYMATLKAQLHVAIDENLLLKTYCDQLAAENKVLRTELDQFKLPAVANGTSSS